MSFVVGLLSNTGFPTWCPWVPWRPLCLLLAPAKSSRHIPIKRLNDKLEERNRKVATTVFFSSAKRSYNDRQQISKIKELWCLTFLYNETLIGFEFHWGIWCTNKMLPDNVALQLSKVTWAKWRVWFRPDITGRWNTADHCSLFFPLYVSIIHLKIEGHLNYR